MVHYKKMKIFILLSLTFYYSIAFSQNVFWDFPDTVYSLHKGDLIVLKPFPWDPNNQGRLLPEAIPQLNKLKDFMLEHNNFKFIISANTDYWGSDAYNLTVSQKQAESLNGYLSADSSFNKKVICLFEGKGESNLLFTQSYIDCLQNEQYKKLMHYLNKRIEIILE
jgi:hypothetical protein